MFIDYLKKSALEINKTLEVIFKDFKNTAGKVSKEVVKFIDIVDSSTDGGKRIRGVLINFGFEIVSGKNNPEVLKAAAAYEIFQTAILAHDDIADESPMRRGKQTIYMALGGDHYGVSQTITLGDIGFFEAIKILADLNLPEDRKNQAIKCFTETMVDTGFGQLMDINFGTFKKIPSEDEILQMFKLKTARYTISGPLMIGASLAGGNLGLLANLKAFGDNVGIAFQLQDDILGVFGTEEEIGKSVTSDIEEGKKTVLLIHALEKSNNRQKEILEKYYGQGKINLGELEKVREVFKETGALKYCEDLAENLVEEGKKLIPEITKNKEYQQILTELSNFMVKRQS